MMKTAIRVILSKEVDKALRIAKRKYPALSDAEILKLGLSKIVSSNEVEEDSKERDEIQRTAAYSVGYDYLSDSEEEVYTENMGKKVRFE